MRTNFDIYVFINISGDENDWLICLFIYLLVLNANVSSISAMSCRMDEYYKN